MNGQTRQDHDLRFLTGLVAGGVVGAGLAMWLAPRAAAEIKERAAESVKNLGCAGSGLSELPPRSTTIAVRRSFRTS